VLGLALVAVSLGASNLAAAIAIGLEGVDAQTRRRVALIFGVFEAGMPLVGLAVGRQVAGSLGGAASGLAGALLVGVGVVTLVTGGADRGGIPAGARPGRLVVAGAALSLDNLAVGFALASFAVSYLVVALVVGLVSVTMSLVGLEVGDRLGAAAGRRSGWLSGGVLIGVGIAVAAGLLG
jgi:manganese efflux pump family protein